MKVLDKIKVFSEAENILLTLHSAMVDTCEMYHFDQCSFYFKNHKTDLFYKAYEYKTDRFFKKWTNKLNPDLKVYIDLFKNPRPKMEQDFYDLFQGQFYYYTQNFYDAAERMRILNYQRNEKQIVNELFIWAIEDGYVGYVVFEKYVQTSTLPIEKREELFAFSNVLQTKLKEYESNIRFRKNIEIRDLVINDEDVGMCIIKKDTYEVLYFNEVRKEQTKMIEIGKPCYFSNDGIQPCEKCLRESLQEKPFITDDQRVMMVKSIPLTLTDGTEAYLMCSKEDVSVSHSTENYDSVTGALQFRYFEKLYETSIRKNDYSYALFTIDIDKFQYVNNLFGREEGDRVLQKIASTIQNFTLNDEMFCRMSDDRFAILLRYSDISELELRIADINSIFRIMQRLHFKDVKVVIVGGFCLVDKEQTLSFLLNKADTARRSIKGAYQNTFQLYDQKMQEKEEKESHIQLRMQYAQDNDEFVPYFQAKINLNTNEICGMEALARWKTPKGLMYPEEFLPTFEKNGFITTFDFIIYQKVIQYLRTCLDRKMKVYPVSLNVSRYHIYDKLFLKKLLGLLKKYNVPNDLIELEVTENIFAEDKVLLQNFISDLRKAKFKVSIDDFGTVYSSIGLLTGVEVDVLKIDQEFMPVFQSAKVTDLSRKNEIIIRHIINMAKDMKFDVICEGVETEEQANWLRQIGCEKVQGFLFSKPLSILDFEKKYYPNEIKDII
ncbi:MAG: phosphodiesterase [Bacillota bacterium]